MNYYDVRLQNVLVVIDCDDVENMHETRNIIKKKIPISAPVGLFSELGQERAKKEYFILGQSI